MGIDIQLDAPTCITLLDIVSKNSWKLWGTIICWVAHKHTTNFFLRMHVDMITIGYCLVTVVLNYMLWYCKIHRGLLCFCICGGKEKENIVCVFLAILKASRRTRTKSSIKETSDINSFSGKVKCSPNKMFLIHLMVVFGGILCLGESPGRISQTVSYLEVYLEKPKFNITCFFTETCLCQHHKGCPEKGC